MKRRHIRLLAAVLIVFVALTGADFAKGGSRGGSKSHSHSHSSHSGGGGCSKSKKSSSSSGYNHNARNTRTSGSTTSRAATDARSDITLTGCRVDKSAKQLKTNVTVRNTGSRSYSYDASIAFNVGGVSGGSGYLYSFDVRAGQTKQTTVTDGYTGSTSSINSSGLTCNVTSATKR